MKSPKYTFLAMAFLLLAFTSCYKEYAITPIPPIISTMSWQLNGITDTAATMIAIDSTGKMKIAGETSSSDRIYLAAPGGFEQGSYNIGSNGVGAAITSGKHAYYATAGTIIVDSVTATVITGTFNFNAAATTGNSTGMVTNGTFHLRYQATYK